MKAYPPIVREVVDAIRKLPGFGEKSATRLVLYLINAPLEETERLASLLLNMKKSLRLCKRCFHLADSDLCSICSDPSRNTKELCVVETTSDLIAIEQSGVYKGLYHVLHGILSPVDNIGPSEIRLQELLERVEKEPPEEIIIATNPTTGGEATAHYILELLKDKKLKITRIGFGIPVGGDIKYIDNVTIAKAFEGRRPFSK